MRRATLNWSLPCLLQTLRQQGHFDRWGLGCRNLFGTRVRVQGKWCGDWVVLRPHPHPRPLKVVREISTKISAKNLIVRVLNVSGVSPTINWINYVSPPHIYRVMPHGRVKRGDGEQGKVGVELEKEV
mgnify:CR=1 FL=1